MKVDSLDELGSAFAEWRRSKKQVREAMPEELLVRARRATKMHGVKAVVRVVQVERSRLFRTQPVREKVQGETNPAAMSVPSFSRLELAAPLATSSRPIAEVETGTGVKLRVFEETPGMMGLLSAVCGLGGVR
jgi:hypothetical protein